MTIVEKMLERRAWDWITAEPFNDDAGVREPAGEPETTEPALELIPAE